jgi:hypothetical protein
MADEAERRVSGRVRGVSGAVPMMADMRNSAIAVSGLRKAYGDKTVLDGIDLVLQRQPVMWGGVAA